MMDIRKILDINPDTKIDIRKPDHGPCCCCQTCGYDHDYCKCWENRAVEVAEYVEQLQAESQQLKEILAEWVLYINADEEIQPPILKTSQALAAQPQKGQENE